MCNPAASRTTLIYFWAFIALGLTTASIGPTLDALASQTSASLEQISLLFPVRSLGYLIGALLAGRLFDRLPGHPLMALGLALMAAGMALTPTLPLLPLLMLVLLAVGLGEGMLDVGTNTLIVWLHGIRVGPYINALHFFFGLGALLAPFLVAQSVQRSGSVAWAYWLVAGAALPAMIAVLRFPSPSHRSEERDAEEGKIQNPALPLILILIAFFSLYVGAEVSFGGWVYLYAINAAGASASTAAYLTSAFWGAFTAGRLVSIAAGARLRPRLILQIDFAGALASLALVLLRPHELWALWTGSLGFGFFIASIFPTMFAYAGTRIRITAKITGYIFLGATFGGMGLPWLIGQWFESTGPQIMTWAIALDLGLAVLTAAGLAVAFRRPAAERAA